MISQRFTKFAWGLLFYNLLVIVWGAFVRASISGDGCGSHWPFCNGEIIPVGAQTKTYIEFAHRVSSGLVLPLVLGMLIAAFRLFPAKHVVRKTSVAVMFFTITEALVGMWLVKAGLVAQNDSVNRAVVLGVHLINTFLLIAMIALTAWWSSGRQPIRLKGQGAVGWALGLALFGIVLLGVSGAVTALGDTLYPAKSLIEGFKQDVSPTAHFLIRLRVLHPLIATAVSLYLILISGVVSHLRPSADVKKWFKVLWTLIIAQMAVGFINVGLMAPIGMQLVHLLLADGMWIAALLATVSALQDGVPVVESEAEPATVVKPPAGFRAALKDYIALTKPRVISLLLFTTIAAMFAAADGWPGGWLLLLVSIGGYMSAGAANAINMAVERDLDLKMKRTSKRPTVTQNISASNALLFGFMLEVASFLLLWWSANLLTAVLALSGLAFYVVVYTLLLKRRTWQNIVIGGAAGAFPPLVGWAAVQGDLNFMAWILFAIVFMWTPVHFWALAILIKDDYERAGVPMLPVVRGERVTIIQIALYAILTAATSILPILIHQAGWIYLATMFMLNGFLFLRCINLYRAPERPQVVSLYKYSMLYLALLFLMVAVDRAVLM